MRYEIAQINNFFLNVDKGFNHLANALNCYRFYVSPQFLRADDLALSLKDGRYWGQIKRMEEKKANFKVEGLVRLQYVVEGRLEKFVTRCADGCQGVGKCGNPSLIHVQVNAVTPLQCLLHTRVPIKVSEHKTCFFVCDIRSQQKQC
jgi:hypothetical protein